MQDDSYFKAFIKDAYHDLKKNKKTFAYSMEQVDELLKMAENDIDIVKVIETKYDSNNRCYWISAEVKKVKRKRKTKKEGGKKECSTKAE